MGDINLSQLSGTSLTIAELNSQLRTLPFLAKKRLVILSNVLSSKNKTLAENLIETIKLTPDSTILVIFETKVDKRTAIFKSLNKLATVKSFPLLDENSSKKWINNQVNKLGGKIDIAATNLLFEWVGADLWQLKQEINKLVTYDPNITEQTVRLLTPPSTQTIIFALSDEVLKGSLKISLSMLDNLRDQGENDIYLFSMILYGYRNLVTIALAQKEGAKSPSEIKEKTKLHPFVIAKSMALINKTNLHELTKKYKIFLDIDVAIKTGTIEVQSALDLLVTKLTS